ncbi:transcription initiation factor iia small chain [Cordyceps fumosorosea ARSEF 2679]|uniref:Transcription initiation factor IIA subunit 2 n=1 Tax=Cordyceps fumosorosea (strain ARSEF 2679) TaxID=1081104 RepID=A0A168AJL2_CORFA|nr:transcription initiation factor iia small chain [Cordyceps fumosorosea ARSEF 2679]OAA68838.1 transcription initiation factor iia small chain [Cordyceps fumosorosea ARSEF 2679]
MNSTGGAGTESTLPACARRNSGELWLTIPDSIGLALTDTLDDLISESRIHPQLAMKILGNFDQAITEALQKNVRSRLQFKVNSTGDSTPPARWWRRGSLDTYRLCDEVWTFLIKNVTFKMDNGSQTVVADKVKIVSCNAKRPGEGA